MLDHFADHLSTASRAALPAGPVMPFANLVDADDRRKVHGLRNTTTGDTPGRSSRARQPVPPATSSAQTVKQETAAERRAR